MKKILILFGKSNWKNAQPFSNKDYQYSYEFFYTLCKQNGIQMYRASYEWYDYKNHFFKHAWIYNGPGGNWSRVDHVSPDLIYDKTKGRAEVYYKKELIRNNFPIINDLTFTQIIDDKFLTGLIFAKWSKENHIVRSPEELASCINKILTPIAVLKPVSDSGGKGVQIFQKNTLSEISFHGEYILQEFIDSSHGVPGVKTGLHDLRLVFVNDDLIYAYIRNPQPNSYLANLAQGGSLTIVPQEKIPHSLTPIIEHAQKIFSSFNPKIYTIDIMFDEKEQPWVVELNSMPGLYFTPEEKPSMEKMYATLLTVFQDKLK